MSPPGRVISGGFFVSEDADFPNWIMWKMRGIRRDVIEMS